MSIDLNSGTAHSKCMAAGAHICQVPSGRRCAEQPCDEAAGTHWGPYWCPAHDKERLDRVSAGFARIAADLKSKGSTVADRHTCTECGEQYTVWYGDGLCSDCAADIADNAAELKLP